MKYKYFIPGGSFVFPETIHGLSLDISDLNSETGCMAADKYSDVCERSKGATWCFKCDIFILLPYLVFCT